MKSGVWATILIVVIVAALVRLTWHYAGQPEPGEPVAVRMPAACSACGKAYADEIGRQPAKCRYCGETAVWRAAQCHADGCGSIFPLVDDPSQPDSTGQDLCPKCGSWRTGEVKANAFDSP